GIAILDVDAWIVLFDPSIDMLDIEGHHLAQSGDLLLQGDDGGLQEGLQEVLIQALQFLGQPVAAGKGFVDVEAIGSVGIEHEVKARSMTSKGCRSRKRRS